MLRWQGATNGEVVVNYCLLMVNVNHSAAARLRPA